MPLRDVILERLKSARRSNARVVVLVAILWTGAIVVASIGANVRGVSEALQVADFAHFYTIGHLARTHQVSTMYDPAALHDAHVALVPKSGTHIFPPVYPPQVALLFAPLSLVSYEHAIIIWNVLTLALYALIIWSTWKVVAPLLPNRILVFTAAAAFPPLWALVLSGQNTIAVLVAWWAGWLALERRRDVMAGVAFGLLAIKPQFGIPLAVIVLARREWRMLGGALISVAAQACIVWVGLGWDAFSGFARTLTTTIGSTEILESKPFMSHSIRWLIHPAPDAIAVPIWIAVSVAVLWYTARVWRSKASVRVRLGVVMVASVLVSPHSMVYDLTVLVLPLLWFGAYMQEPARLDRSTSYWRTVIWLFAALFIPTAAFIPLQASVLVMVWLFIWVAREVLRGERAVYIARAA